MGEQATHDTLLVMALRLESSLGGRGLTPEAMGKAADEIERLGAEVARATAAVREHHDQRGDDRCHLDDLKLYREVLGEGIDPYAGALPPEADMLESCRRYIRQRRCPGPEGVAPLPGEMTIAQLTAEVARVAAERDALLAAIVRPWTRDGDGAKLWKVNLAWFDTAATEAEAIAMARRIAGLEAAGASPAAAEGPERI